MLIQGILSGRGKSINSIATYGLNKVAHTTLTRFLNGHDMFFKDMKKVFERYVMSMNSNVYTKYDNVYNVNGNVNANMYGMLYDTYILDDTQIERRSVKLPFVYKNFDHSKGRYVNSQSLLTIGTLLNGEFIPLRMKFIKKGKKK